MIEFFYYIIIVCSPICVFSLVYLAYHTPKKVSPKLPKSFTYKGIRFVANPLIPEDTCYLHNDVYHLAEKPYNVVKLQCTKKAFTEFNTSMDKATEQLQFLRDEITKSTMIPSEYFKD